MDTHFSITLARLRQEAGSARLIAISKGQPLERVQEALMLGQTCFGENRVQEAEAKFSALQKDNPALELHLIGPLQRNKVKQALALFDVIETVDRPELVEALAAAEAASGRKPRYFIQVNIGKEPQKSGVDPDNILNLLKLCHVRHLNVIGLMCIPPAEEDPRPHFKALATLAKQHHLPELSMGMSGDYRIALEEGATYIRVGSALFGARA